MFGNKRFKSNPTLDAELNPPPDSLKKTLELLCQNFYGSRMRSMEIMDTSTNKLYGMLTSYESHNFFWLQPTRIKSMISEIEYHSYLKRINRDGRDMKLDDLKEFSIGQDCLARYSADNKWYRAMIVGQQVRSKWPVVFIDYGNFQYTAQSDIAGIITEDNCNHYHAPVQAVCCRLYNIAPKLPEYRREIDIKLRKLFDSHLDDFFEIQVRHVRPDYVVDCDIFFCKRSTHKHDRLYKTHIGQELVDSGLATFVDPHAAHAIKMQPDHTLVDMGNDSEDEDVKPDIKPNIKSETSEESATPRRNFKREHSPINSQPRLYAHRSNPFNREDHLSGIMGSLSHTTTENLTTNGLNLFGKETNLQHKNPFATTSVYKSDQKLIGNDTNTVKQEPVGVKPTKPFCSTNVSPFEQVKLSGYGQFKFTQKNPFC